MTENMPDLPEWLAVRSIAPSRFDPGTAYVAIDGHQMNVRDPYVYRTRDYGESFEKITDGIPPSMLSYTKIIIEDTKRQGLLYVGTGERHLRVVRRRRQLAAAPEQPARRPGVGHCHPGALQRPGGWAPTGAASGSSTISRRCSS